MAEPRIDGCVQFYIAVPPQEMRQWPAAAISQFFNGLAQIVFAAGDAAQIEIVRTENTND